jgi:hypothetical protein
VLCDKGLLITFGQLYFKQSSATRSKCLSQLHYAHSQGTNRGPERVFYPLDVDENGYALFSPLILEPSCGHAHFDELCLTQSLQAVAGLRMYDKLPLLLMGEIGLITFGTGQNRPWILETLI